MKLLEDEVVVEALTNILEAYPNLEYDENASRLTYKDEDMLKVKIKDLSTKVGSVGGKIASELSKATGRKFICPNPERKNEYYIIMELPRRDAAGNPILKECT